MITSISTDWGVNPRIVRITSTDDYATVTSTGYVLTQQENIAQIQNGNFQWLDGDIIAIFYNFGDGFFTYDSETFTFIPAAGSGDVVGPGTSVTGGLVVFGNTTGESITNPSFNPSITGSQLIGYTTSSAAVDLISLGTGLEMVGGVLSATGGTGLVDSVVGTANEIDVDSTDPANPIVSIADNVILPGTEGAVLPTGGVADRPISPIEGEQRFNSDSLEMEYWNGTDWISVGSGGTGNVISDGTATSNQIPKFTSDAYHIGPSSLLDDGTLVSTIEPIQSPAFNALGKATTVGPGTVQVFNTSPIILGSSTTFTQDLGPNSTIVIDSVPYTVSYIISDTVLELTTSYTGANASGLTYLIDAPFFTMTSDLDIAIGMITNWGALVIQNYPSNAFGPSLVPSSSGGTSSQYALSADLLNFNYYSGGRLAFNSEAGTVAYLDGVGNLYTNGNVTIGQYTGPGQTLFMPTNAYDLYFPQLISSNDGAFSTLTIEADLITSLIDLPGSFSVQSSDGLLFDVSGSGTVMTLHNVLDDGNTGDSTFVASVSIKNNLTVALTGTVAISNGSNALTGTGTAFTSQLTNGSLVQIQGYPQTFNVVINDDADIILSSTWPNADVTSGILLATQNFLTANSDNTVIQSGISSFGSFYVNAVPQLFEEPQTIQAMFGGVIDNNPFQWLTMFNIYGNAEPFCITTQADGTKASPLASTPGDILGANVYVGYDGSAYSSQISGTIFLVAGGSTVSPGIVPTDAFFALVDQAGSTFFPLTLTYTGLIQTNSGNLLDDGAGNMSAIGSITAESGTSAQLQLTNDGVGNSQILMNNGLIATGLYTTGTFDGIPAPSGNWDVLYFQTGGEATNNHYKAYQFFDYDASAIINILPNVKGSFGYAGGTVTLDLPGIGLWYFWDNVEVAGTITADNYMDMAAVSAPGVPATGYARIYVVIDGESGLEVPYYEDSSGASYAWGETSGSGSVTEVGTTDYLTVDGTPGASITTSGTLSINPVYLYYDPTNFNASFGGAGNTTLTGIYNTSGGYGAGGSLTDGEQNTFFGYSSGNLTTSTYYNSAFGNQSLGNNVGTSNNAFGNLAGYHLTSGSYNVAMGDSALGDSETGDFNVAIGHHAMWIGEGTGNVAVGANCLNGIEGTINNVTAIGYQIGSTFTSLSDIVLLGTSAVCADGISNSAAIGANSMVAVSNAYSYGPTGTTVNHGFGTDTPIAKVHVGGDFYRNSVSELNFNPNGRYYTQTAVQTDGVVDVTIATVPVPILGDASTGSVAFVEVTILAVDAGGIGWAEATSSMQARFDGTSSIPLGTVPTIVFNTSGSLSLIQAEWSVSSNNIVLTGVGVNATIVNWLVDYSYFALGAGQSP